MLELREGMCRTFLRVSSWHGRGSHSFWVRRKRGRRMTVDFVGGVGEGVLDEGGELGVADDPAAVFGGAFGGGGE